MMIGTCDIAAERRNFRKISIPDNPGNIQSSRMRSKRGSLSNLDNASEPEAIQSTWQPMARRL